MIRFYRLFIFSACFLLSFTVYGQFPIATDDSDQTQEDTPTTFNVTDNDSDPLEPLLQINASTVDLQPGLGAIGIQNTLTNAEGNWSVNPSGDVTYEPALNYYGSTSITYTVQNTAGVTSNPATITVDVVAINDPPVITGYDALSTAEETDLTIELSNLTIEDPDNDPGDFILSVQDGANYTRSGNTITPNPDFSGTLTVSVSVSDGSGGSDTENIEITVTEVNTAPVVTAQTLLSTPEETALTLVVGNFTITDPDDATHTLTVQNGSNYSRSGNTITPNTDFNGDLTVPIIVNDGTEDSEVFNATVTVTPVNDVPVITAQVALSTPEETPLTIVVTNVTIEDPDDNAFTLTVIDGDNFSTSGNTVTPEANFNGNLVVQIVVNDGTANSAIYDLDITVVGVNNAPTISAIANQATDENVAKGPINFTIGDAETAPGDLVVSGSSSNVTLVPTANITFGGSGANRNVTVTPAANQSGTTTITISVSDGDEETTTTFELTVNAVNDAPTISAIADQSTAENTATSAITFSIADPDTPPANLTVSGTSSDVTIVPNANIVFSGGGGNRKVVITPAAGQSGTTTITITVSDGTASASTNFTLTVSSVNDLPTISAITDQSTPESTATSAISFTIGDPETPAADLTLSGASSNTTLAPNASIVFGGSGASRNVIITPAAGQSGTSTITITVSDGTASASTNFVLTVTSVNDAPTITSITNQSTPENTTTGAIAFTIGDPETPATNLTLSGTSSNTTLVSNGNISFAGSGADRTITITPTAGQSGVTTITVTVSDGAASTSINFQLTVNSIDDAPTITAISAQTINEDAATPALPFTVGDPDTPIGSLTVTGSSSNKTLVPDANIALFGNNISRTATITPAANQNGTTTITLTVTDGISSTSTTFQLTVVPVNDPPVITANVPLSTPENTSLVLEIDDFTIQDPDNESGDFKLKILPGNYLFSGTTVTPPADFDGELTVTVTVSDGNLESPPFNFVIHVNNVNVPPVITGQNPDPIETFQNISFILTIGNLTVTDPDNPPNQTDFILIVSPGDHYIVSGALNTTITPESDYIGPLSVVVKVNDGKNDSPPFTVTINVIEKTEMPIINGQGPLITNEDEPITLTLVDFSVTDPNYLKGGYTMLVSDGQNYTVNDLTITPALNMNGILKVGIRVSNGKSTSEEFIAQIYVTPVNDAPQITAIETTPILYEPGSGPVPLTGIFELEDVDNEYLNFAELRFDSGYSAPNDELIFENTDTSPVRAIYDQEKGILSMIGYATKTEYREAIRSITYNYKLTLDENGEQSQISTEPKIIYITLSDGQLVSDNAERSIELETSVELDIPNTFTPNSDGANDTWAVQPITNSDQFGGTIIRVYNKRGLLLYEAEGLEKEWDGTYNGEVLPVDTYYYTIDLKLSFVRRTYKGAVTILY